MVSFARVFSKARRLVMFSKKTHDEGTCARSNTSRPAVALASAKFPYPFKAPRKGEFRRSRKRGYLCLGKGGERFAEGEVNTAQVGGSPFCTKGVGGLRYAKWFPFPRKVLLKPLHAFLLYQQAQNENCFAALSSEPQAVPA